jgi:hypothetical protein
MPSINSASTVGDHIAIALRPTRKIPPRSTLRNFKQTSTDTGCRILFDHGQARLTPFRANFPSTFKLIYSQ